MDTVHFDSQSFRSRYKISKRRLHRKSKNKQQTYLYFQSISSLIKIIVKKIQEEKRTTGSMSWHWRKSFVYIQVKRQLLSGKFLKDSMFLSVKHSKVGEYESISLLPERIQ